MILRGYITLTGGNYQTGSRYVAPENLGDRLFVQAGGLAHLLIEHDQNAGTYTSMLCLECFGRRKAVKTKFTEVSYASSPNSGTVCYEVEVDDSVIKQAINYCAGDDRVAAQRRVLEDSFVRGVNPLPLMRTVYPGAWKFKRWEVAGWGCVYHDDRLIWEGKTAVPVDASLN